MAINSTYGMMQAQIADELGDRQDLLVPLTDSSESTSPIQNAIQSAIAKWERERFYFNDFLLTTPLSAPIYAFQTVIGQEYYGKADYAPLVTLATIKKLWLLVTSQRYTCNPRTSGYLDDISVNQSSLSRPIDYAYSALQLRFYPIPDGAYPVGIEGTQRLSALVNSADTNAWMQDAYDLIRCEAKVILARDTLHDAEEEANAMKAIYGDPSDPRDRGYLYALKSENVGRLARGRIRPSYF